MMSQQTIPAHGSRTTLASSMQDFLARHSDLHLGGAEDFHHERNHHLAVLGFHNLPEQLRAPIGTVEFTAVRGPHGTIPVRVFYPASLAGKQGNGAAALAYMHGQSSVGVVCFTVQYRIFME